MACFACRKNGSLAGFTLIELLVVIAIISLLLSIVMPSLNRARELARAVSCMVQMRHIGFAAHQYMHEHEGYLPAVINRWGSAHGCGFLAALYPYYGFPRPRNIPDDYNYKNWYMGYGSPFLCPSAKNYADDWSGALDPTYPLLGDFESPGRGGSYQFTMPAEPNHGGWSLWCGQGLPDIERGRHQPHYKGEDPPGTIITIEQRMVHGYTMGQFPLPHYMNLLEPWHGPNYLHNDAANFLMLDGHVEKLPIGTQVDQRFVPVN